MHIIPKTGKMDISLCQIPYGLTISERYSFEGGIKMSVINRPCKDCHNSAHITCSY